VDVEDGVNLKKKVLLIVFSKDERYSVRVIKNIFDMIRLMPSSCLFCCNNGDLFLRKKFKIFTGKYLLV
jgi:hypothetical protein